MTFQKGKSGNPKGRPLGAKDRIKHSITLTLKRIVETRIDNLEDDLQKLTPGERIRAVIQLLGYVLPKRTALDPKETLELEYSHLERLLSECPEEALDEITKRIETLKSRNDGE